MQYRAIYQRRQRGLRKSNPLQCIKPSAHSQTVNGKLPLMLKADVLLPVRLILTFRFVFGCCYSWWAFKMSTWLTTSCLLRCTSGVYKIAPYIPYIVHYTKDCRIKGLWLHRVSTCHSVIYIQTALWLRLGNLCMCNLWNPMNVRTGLGAYETFLGIELQLKRYQNLIE